MPNRFGVRLLLAIGSGTAFWLAFPGGPAPWLAWILMIPVIWAATGQTWKQSCCLYSIYGIIIWLGSISWQPKALIDFSGTSIGMAGIVWLVTALYHALPYGIFGGLTGYFKGRPLSPFENAALLAVLLQLYPNIFDGNLTHSQYVYPIVIQIASIGGIMLLHLVILWINFLGANAILSFQKNNIRNFVQSVGYAAIIMIGVLGFGYWHLADIQHQLAFQPTLAMGMIQPNFPIESQNHRFNSIPKHDQIRMNRMVICSQKLSTIHPGPAVIIWPEMPLLLSISDNPNQAALFDRLVDTIKIPVMAVGYMQTEQMAPIQGYYNTAFFEEPDTTFVQTYRKVFLMPFSEYLPFDTIFPKLRHYFPGTFYFVSGKSIHGFRIQNVKIQPLICFEATNQQIVREAMANGAQILVNTADDAWFGRTREPYIHLALSLFRAVEYKVSIVRVTNSGVSCLILPTGEIVSKYTGGLFTEKCQIIPVPYWANQQATLYQRLGPQFIGLLAMYIIWCLLYKAWKNKK